MSKALETIVVRRGLPNAEGHRKVAVGKMPSKTPKGEVDRVFTLAQAVIDRFGFSGEAGVQDDEWEGLLDSLQAIHTNTFNTGGLKGKAGFLRRELIRQKRRYATAYTTNKSNGKSGKAKARAKKAAKAAASRALRAKMKSPKRG